MKTYEWKWMSVLAAALIFGMVIVPAEAAKTKAYVEVEVSIHPANVPVATTQTFASELKAWIEQWDARVTDITNRLSRQSLLTPGIAKVPPPKGSKIPSYLVTANIRMTTRKKPKLTVNASATVLVRQKKTRRVVDSFRVSDLGQSPNLNTARDEALRSLAKDMASRLSDVILPLPARSTKAPVKKAPKKFKPQSTASPTKYQKRGKLVQVYLELRNVDEAGARRLERAVRSSKYDPQRFINRWSNRNRRGNRQRVQVDTWFSIDELADIIRRQTDYRLYNVSVRGNTIDATRK